MVQDIRIHLGPLLLKNTNSDLVLDKLVLDK